jgi:hypothetical protein
MKILGSIAVIVVGLCAGCGDDTGGSGGGATGNGNSGTGNSGAGNSGTGGAGLSPEACIEMDIITAGSLRQVCHYIDICADSPSPVFLCSEPEGSQLSFCSCTFPPNPEYKAEGDVPAWCPIENPGAYAVENCGWIPGEGA